METEQGQYERKLKRNLTYKHRQKNSIQNTSKQNLTTFKIIISNIQVEFIPGR